MGTPLTDPPAGLAEHLVFAGEDLPAAQRISCEVFCPHSVRPIGSEQPLRVRQYAATVAEMTISQISFGSAVQIYAGEHPERFFCIQIVNAGRAGVASGKREIRSTTRMASVPTPTEALRMQWDPGTAQTVIKIGVPTVSRYLGGLLGHEPEQPLVPQLELDLNGAGRRWTAIYDLLLAEITSGDGKRGGPGASAAAVQDLVLSSLLLHHPTNYLEELNRPAARGTRHYVRRAIDYADQHLETPLTIAALAEVAGVGVRALQDGFREGVGATPTTWIRERRLERAHAELLAAEPGDGTTVTEVATRWGFSHLGRFSVRYRQRFGVSPTQTLRG